MSGAKGCERPEDRSGTAGRVEEAFRNCKERDESALIVYLTGGYPSFETSLGYLLACSEAHIRAVFTMLERQPQRAQFTGGLEAKRLRSWHVDLLADLRPGRIYFAYDTPDDLEPLRVAGAMLDEAGLRNHDLCAYVLIGYPGDTMAAAEVRLRETWSAGFMPFAMLWRDDGGGRGREWGRFQRLWARPQITMTNVVAR